jgi:hypothetical protein
VKAETTLRDSEKFRRATIEGRCWKCGGPVVLYVFPRLEDDTASFAFVCQVVIWDDAPGTFSYCEKNEGAIYRTRPQ